MYSCTVFVQHRLGTSRAATHLAMNGGTPHSSVLDNSLYGSGTVVYCHCGIYLHS